MPNYDFSGWATKSGVRCADGRTIMKGAFKHNSGNKVPLVWNHNHDDPNRVVGHVVLEHRDEGMYAYGYFNETPTANTAKELVKHRDITSLSICANKLTEQGKNVVHGEIREVSLVLAGANPEAYIDSVLVHGEDYSDTVAVLYSGDLGLDLFHAEEKTEESKKDEGEVKMENEKTTEKEKTVADVYEEMTEEQKTAVEFIVGNILAENGITGEDDKEDKEMAHNAFEGFEGNELNHSEVLASILADGKRYGTLSESALQHGIEDIDMLFPEAKTMNNPPEWIKRDTGWVGIVMSGVHHTPFSRIKSVFADITEEDARAKGYLGAVDENGKTYRDEFGNKVDAEGNRVYKKEEVFGLLKRTTTPTTVYKKQRLDRDDIIDITDFDMVGWLKSEMRIMLDEELARAFLIGDGRLSSSDDKINEQNIRPIMSDEDLYAIKVPVTFATADTDDDKAKKFIRAAIKARKNYKGSGNPTLFCTEDILTDCLLLEDRNGRVIYDSEAKLTSALRVSKIVTVPVMEGVTGPKGGDLIGIIVNLSDYNVGADKGGAVSMFDDFDIDYNAQKYLIETRCSGALIKPKSAMVFEFKAESSAG